MIKTRNLSRDRDRKERFEKFCGAIIHDNESEYQLKLIGNKVKNEIISYIFQNNIITRHRKRYNPLALYHSSYWSHCWMDTHFLMYLLRVL